MEKKKFKLTDETIEIDGHILHRIECVEAIPSKGVKVGDKGGFIESENNLLDNAWVYDNAVVYGNAKIGENARIYDDAKVYGDAMVCGNAIIYNNAEVCDYAQVCDNAFIYDNAWVLCDAKVYGNARIYDSARIYNNAIVSDNALVYGKAQVCGDAEVHGNAIITGDAIVYSNDDYIVFKNWWSSGRYFTWTRSNNMWKVGCFYGTGKKLIKKAYLDSKISGKQYKKIVKYVKSIN